MGSSDYARVRFLFGSVFLIRQKKPLDRILGLTPIFNSKVEPRSHILRPRYLHVSLVARLTAEGKRCTVDEWVDFRVIHGLV